MMTRRLFLAAVAALALVTPAAAQDKLKVVATFSILGDLVRNIGGDRVALTTLVGPDGDAHVFQPSPADAQAATEAGLIVVNGLGLEGWMDRLMQASGTKAPIVTASDGAATIASAGEDEHGHAEEADHDHGPVDPHAWQSVPNAEVYVTNIERGLAAADPAGAEVYRANAAAYLDRLRDLDARIRAGVASLPEDRRTIVTSHDAFGYFGATYGLHFEAPQGLSTESEPSARDVARLIEQIRDEGVKAVFVESLVDPRLLDQIAAETGAKDGGTVYSDALSPPDGPAGTYIAMMENNLAKFTAALAP